MSPNLVRRLKTLAFICLFSSCAGIMYELIDAERITHMSILLGFSLGLVFGILELFLFAKAEARFRQLSFTRIMVFKAVLYTAIIHLVIIGLNIVIGLADGRKLSELRLLVSSRSMMVLVIYTLVMYALLLFFLQINQLLGDGVLWKFILGKYHRPREEERIFMFLDMKSSTTIAEQLGHVRFYRLLNELFHEISKPVLETKAEIYQYIGDEVVLTWQVKEGLENSNCLKAFFMFRDSINRNAENYLQTFGVKPEFKAGLHFGKVVSAQIGDLKREITYNGDVLNTTSRIQNECNTYQRDCLVSGALMNRLILKNGFQWERMDSVTLRGKETEVELFSVFDTH